MDRLYINNILKQLEEPKPINYDEGFSYARTCSRLLSEHEFTLARKIAIRILNSWDKMDANLYPLWSELMETLGFYPYLNHRESGLENTSLDDNLRQCYHRSDYLPSVTLHADQKRVSDLIFSGQNVALSAPTSYGKSLLIEEIVASHRYHNIVIIQPTLALLDETRIKLRQYADTYRLIVRTTQPYNADDNNIFLLTAERVMEYEQFPQIDFLIIDEFYKISYTREDERVDILNNAFMRIFYSFHPQFYFLGPNIVSISPTFQQDFNVKFVRTDYSLVDNIEIRKADKNDTTPDRMKKLFELLSKMPKGEQTLVYCSSPERASVLALAYYDYLSEKKKPRHSDLPLIEWIKTEIGDKWSLVKELEYGIAVHDAAMPKHLGASIIRYFNNHQLEVIFCTATIIEGVNTSAKNVVIFSEHKGRKKLDYFDVSNIKGRAGRLMEHYVGKIYTFNEDPSQLELDIDMPFCDQQKGLKDEVLINIPAEKVRPELRAHYDELHQLPAEFLTIIKRNGISINNQRRLAEVVREYLKQGNTDILWSQMPKWNSLLSTLTLLASCHIIHFDSRVRSAKQLTYFLSNYYKYKSIIKYFKAFQKDYDDGYDKNLEDAFYVQRRWFQYAVPKALRVGESIINYVCGRMGKPTCSYSYYAQQIETNFLPENISILLEYGIPAVTVRKLERHLPKRIKEDQLVSYIKEHPDLKAHLLSYESDLIDNNL